MPAPRGFTDPPKVDIPPTPPGPWQPGTWVDVPEIDDPSADLRDWPLFANPFMALWNKLSLHRSQIGLFPGAPPVDLRPGPRSVETVNQAIATFCQLWVGHTVGYALHDHYDAVAPIIIADLSATTVSALIAWYKATEAVILPHLLLWVPCWPSKPTNLVAVPGDMRVDLTWNASTDRIPVEAYELQRRINWQILSLDRDYTWSDAETLKSVLRTRYGACSVDAAGLISSGEGGFTSFSRQDFTGVTFADIEVSAFYVSGAGTLIVRSDNGAGPNGWHAYVMVVNPTNITLHTSSLGVLSPPLTWGTFAHATKTGERITFGCEGATLYVKIGSERLLNELGLGYLVDLTYYNGVVGFGSASGTSVWSLGESAYERVMLLPYTHFEDLNRANDLQVDYRVRGVDGMGWSGEFAYSGGVTPIFVSHDISYDYPETVTVALQELAIAVAAAPEFIFDYPETVTASLEGLSIVVTLSPTVNLTIPETVTAALQNLSITVTALTQTNVAHSETVTAALQGLTIAANTVTQTTVAHSETVTAALQNLSITVTPI